MNRAALTATLSSLAALAGCHLISGIEDFTFSEQTGGGGQGGQGAGGSLPCEVPFAGMVVTTDIRLCNGTFELLAPTGKPVIDVTESGVTLECDGTILDGTDANLGTAEMPTVGIRIDAVEGVTLRGCGAKNYRYGLVADGSSNITLENVAFDDNFTDPNAQWVGDVPGGGILFRDVVGGLVTGSTFSRNWNGIELRATSGVTLEGNRADHCTNAGAFLIGSTDNVLSENDVSWAVRGTLTDPADPGNWYGIPTYDAAGITLDGGSHDNTLVDNTATHGGDGIFIRGLEDGGCSKRNLVLRNDVSFSPHNGIESWCDGNVFQENTVDECNFGIWTGGSDRIAILDNTVTGSKADGISMQIAENRHVIVEGNAISNSARVGILVSGREYQKNQPLDRPTGVLANSSQILVQHNEFAGNVQGDIFASYMRLIVAISNCVEKAGTFTFEQVEAARELGRCTAAEGPPTAVLADLGGAELGQPITLDASASQPGASGNPLTFTWLVQPSALRFAGLVLPPSLLAGLGSASPVITVDEPGAYDVNVVVDDGILAAMADDQLTVPALGTRVGETEDDWTYTCDQGCSTTISQEPDGADGDQIHVVTNAGYAFAVLAPKSKDLGLDASALTSLGFFVRAQNDNINGWQGNFPRVVLASSAGTITYEPGTNIMPREGDEWFYVAVPLAGGQGWTRTDAGASLDAIDWIEIHLDTWDFGFELWLDAVTFY